MMFLFTSWVFRSWDWYSRGSTQGTAPEEPYPHWDLSQMMRSWTSNWCCHGMRLGVLRKGMSAFCIEWDVNCCHHRVRCGTLYFPKMTSTVSSIHVLLSLWFFFQPMGYGRSDVWGLDIKRDAAFILHTIMLTLDNFNYHKSSPTALNHVVTM